MTTRNRPSYGSSGKLTRLNQEALEKVLENAVLIVQGLIDATKDGHVLSARLLLDLAEAHVDVEDALNRKPLRSLALRLAKEPQWIGGPFVPPVIEGVIDPPEAEIIG